MPRAQMSPEPKLALKTVPAVEKLGDQDLLTRQQAQSLWPCIEDAISRIAPGSGVVLKFAGTRRAAVGFLDAILQVLEAVRLRHSDRYLLLDIDDTESDLLEGLSYVLDRRDRALPVIVDGRVRILGRLTSAQTETLRAVELAQQSTSEDMGQRLRLQRNAASNRLRDLYTQGLIGRLEQPASAAGGRRYAYVPLMRLWPEADWRMK